MLDAVIVPIYFDVVVNVCPHLPPLGIDIGLNRKRTQGRLVDCLELGMTASFQLLERAEVERLSKRLNGKVEVEEGEEGFITQTRKYPPFNNLYSYFDLGFVFWLIWTCWDDGRAIVSGHIGIGGVQLRLITAGAIYSALEVIRDNQLRNTAKEPERPHV
jgi:hypothetical protein